MLLSVDGRRMNSHVRQPIELQLLRTIPTQEKKIENYIMLLNQWKTPCFVNKHRLLILSMAFVLLSTTTTTKISNVNKLTLFNFIISCIKKKMFGIEVVYFMNHYKHKLNINFSSPLFLCIRLEIVNKQFHSFFKNRNNLRVLSTIKV